MGAARTADRRSTVRPQTLLAVSDVEAASRWYQELLGLASAHGGDEYERLAPPGGSGDEFVLQLHRWDVEDHHGAIGDPDLPHGNGVLVWFAVDDFDDVVVRARQLGAEVVTDTHVNPNARHHEIWLRDLDGYTVVVASPDGTAPG